MGAIIEQYKKIQDIANSDIPVLQGSPCYQLFFQRRELCKNVNKSESSMEQFFELLNYYDDKIKEYLNL